MSSTLEQLKTLTNIVADTGDIEAIKQYQPLDATTNPSLLLKAAELPQYEALLRDAINRAKTETGSHQQTVALAMDIFAVMIGCEIIKTISGRVSTEVDARLSFTTEATISKARELIGLYEHFGIGRERVLIKIASTWEGIQAAKVLEQENIQCNLTLLFSLTQAVACADAGAFLISPFVGRILDWHKKETSRDHYEPQEDPGVVSVTDIYHYYKQHAIGTVVMGASFRNTGEIIALAGCDRLTISPPLLAELQASSTPVEARLSANADYKTMETIELDESRFRYQLNDNAMATEKLAEGIRNFVKDQLKLEAMMTNRLTHL